MYICNILNYIGDNFWSIAQTILGGIAIYLAYTAWNTSQEQLKEMKTQFLINGLIQDKYKNSEKIIYAYERLEKEKEGTDIYKFLSESIEKNGKAIDLIEDNLKNLGYYNPKIFK